MNCKLRVWWPAMQLWCSGIAVSVHGCASEEDLELHWLDVDAGKTTPTTTVLVKYDDGESMSHDLGSGRQSHWEWVLEERPPGEEGGAWLKGEYQR